MQHKLFYSRNSVPKIIGQTDSDHAGTLRETYLRLVVLPLGWLLVILSATETEYIAMASPIEEALRLRQLAMELNGIKKDDSMGTIELAKSDRY
ncbi:unnamed protein product [Hermetia illucens]|uniref:Uncharacterized protein n=1 Tax=Hermetia illucens TaxID=343691 RepID=A0A7R8V6C1_HERIL|nr:unnamed protein product [Hermetia illucens]